MSLHLSLLPFTFISGVAIEDSFAEVLHVEVRVNLGGSEVFVSEQLLNDAQVGAVLEQVCGERMPQGVGADGLGDAGFGAEATDDGEDHRTGHRAAVAVDEGYVA